MISKREGLGHNSAGPALVESRFWLHLSHHYCEVTNLVWKGTVLGPPALGFYHGPTPAEAFKAPVRVHTGLHRAKSGMLSGWLGPLSTG